MQAGVIQPGQNVVIIDDLIATGERRVYVSKETALTLSLGGSAAAAGELVAKQGGKTIEYIFIIEAVFLNPSSKLDAPVYSIIPVKEEKTVDSERDVDLSRAMYRSSADYRNHVEALGDLAADSLGPPS